MLTERMKFLLDNGKSFALNERLYLVYYDGKYYMIDKKDGDVEELEEIDAVALAWKGRKLQECEKAFGFSQEAIDDVISIWSGYYVHKDGKGH
jgi:hypothetical protein